MNHTLTPLEPPYAPEIAELLERYPRGRDGYIIRLFRVFANSTRFLGSKCATNLLDRDSPLTLREREIVILRVTANRDCEYEWGVHVATFAAAADLTEAQVAATRLAASDAPCWSPGERLLLDCVDQLCHSATLSDETRQRFQQHWTAEQQLEIFALCGNYHLISCVANVSRVAREADSPRFPPPAEPADAAR